MAGMAGAAGAAASTSTPGGVTATGRPIAIASSVKTGRVRGGAGARRRLDTRPNVATAEDRLRVEIKAEGTPKALGRATVSMETGERIPGMRTVPPIVMVTPATTAIPASAGA